MTFNLIGLGLNEKSISLEALESLKKCKKIYLENYTVNFPYTKQQLEKSLKIRIKELNRQEVESETFLQDAKKQDIALLVYGDALSATTHISLIQACKKHKIKHKIFHNASILTAIGETGLSLYKFGKTASLPSWKEHTNKPTSFIQIIKSNLEIKAHTLLLIDISLDMEQAKQQLKEASEKENFNLPEKTILISNAGTDKQRIIYKRISSFPAKISKPYAIIIPSELQLSELEFLENI